MPVASRADDKGVTITPVARRISVFAAAEAEFKFTVESPQAFEGKAFWYLATPEKRTLARGEEVVTNEAGKPATVKLRLKMPPVKPGVILPVVLTLDVHAKGNAKPETGLEQPLWIFPNDPFADRAEWLKKLKITLFDPEGKTAEVLKKANVPFEDTRNPAALGELTGGIIVVAEGVSFADYRDLPETLFKASAKGIPVLCLAPAAGALSIPGTDEAPAVAALAFAGNEVITRFDKRFDAAGWGAEGGLVAGRLALKISDGRIVGEVQKEDGGWPWMEAGFASRAKFVFCGFGIIRHWEANPTPRFLFAALLESLEVKNQVAKDKER